jgi:PST family polysaccharide transporter
VEDGSGGNSGDLRRGMTDASPNMPSRIVRNFLSLSGAEVISKLLTLATFAFVARIAGPNGFGYLEFAASVVLCSGFLVDQGFGVYGAREIARSPSSTARLVTEVTSLRLVLAAAVYAGLVLFTSVLDRPAALERLVLLYGLSLFLLPFMLQWVFQGRDRMRVVAMMQVVRMGVFAITVFALLRERERLWPVAIGELCGAAAVVILSIWLYRSQLGLRIPLKFRLSSRLLRAGSTIGLGQLFWSLRTYGATIVIGLIASESDVGFFAAAMRIAIGLNAFVWLYFFNLLPSMSRTWKQEPESFQRLMGRSIRTAGWLALGGGILWVLLAPVMIRLAYGAAFMPATATLQWMSGLCILGAIHGNFRFGLIAAEHQRYATVSSGLGTLIALGLIPLGYSRWGISGAAIALIAGEIAVWSSSFLFSRRLLRLEGPLRHLVRPVVAGAVLVALLWALPQATPAMVRIGVAVIGLGLALYATEDRFRAAIARWFRR